MGAIWLNNIWPGSVHMFCMQPLSADSDPKIVIAYIITFWYFTVWGQKSKYATSTQKPTKQNFKKSAGYTFGTKALFSKMF